MYFKFYRFNLDFTDFIDLKPRYSLIYKTINFTRGVDQNNEGEFIYKGQSFTNSIYLTKELKDEDLIFSGFFSIEFLSNKSGIRDYAKAFEMNVFKFGLNIGLVF